MRTISEAMASLENESSLDKQQASEYLKMLSEGLKHCTAEYSKRAWILIALIITSFLLNQTPTNEISFLSIKIEDISLVKRTLPIGIAFCFYSFMSIVAYQRLIQELHKRIFKVSLPALKDEIFEMFSYASSPFRLANVFTDFHGNNFGVFCASSSVYALTATLAPPVYLIAVHIENFNKFGPIDFLTLSSAGLSLVLTFLSFATIFATARIIGRVHE